MNEYNIFPNSTKLEVLKKINGSIPKFEKLLNESYNNFQLFDGGVLKLDKNQGDIKKLLEYTIFLCISWLDLSFDMKTHLTTTNNYERIYSLRNLTIHLNEGYKRNYHFVKMKRKESLWILNIYEICENEHFLDFQQKIMDLTNDFISYEKEFQTDSFKSTRDIFVHYQGSPIEVYESFNNLDILFLFQNATKYLNLSSSIIGLITDITNRIRKNNEK